MIGDGSDSKLAGPPGSAAIEKLFQDYFIEKNEPYDPSEFDGRSDYGPFIVSDHNTRTDQECNYVYLRRRSAFHQAVYSLALRYR